MLEEELDHIKSIDINIIPPPDEHQNQEEKFDQIYKTIELSGFKQLWKEADHDQLRMLKSKNLLTGQEKLLLRIAELIRLCENNIQLIQHKIAAMEDLKRLVTFKHKRIVNKR
jgi:hypothetical protein